MRNNNSQQHRRQPVPLSKLIGQQIEEHPQIAAYLIEKILIGFRKVLESLGKIEIQLKEKAEELKTATPKKKNSGELKH